jgi:hypothetical protein
MDDCAHRVMHRWRPVAPGVGYKRPLISVAGYGAERPIRPSGSSGPGGASQPALPPGCRTGPPVAVTGVTGEPYSMLLFQRSIPGPHQRAGWKQVRIRRPVHPRPGMIFDTAPSSAAALRMRAIFVRLHMKRPTSVVRRFDYCGVRDVGPAGAELLEIVGVRGHKRPLISAGGAR